MYPTFPMGVWDSKSHSAVCAVQSAAGSRPVLSSLQSDLHHLPIGDSTTDSRTCTNLGTSEKVPLIVQGMCVLPRSFCTCA